MNGYSIGMFSWDRFRRGWLPAVLGILLATLSTTAAQGASVGWIATWGASPEPHPPVGPQRPSSTDQTIGQVVRVSAGGHRVRIRLTNVFGATPLAVGAAHVAMAATGDSIEPATDRVLTFSGEKTVTIAPGTSMLSDTVD